MDNWNNQYSSFNVEYKDGKLIRVFGRLEIHSAVFAFSANLQYSGRYPIRGHVKAVSSTGRTLKIRGNAKKAVFDNLPESEHKDTSRKLNVETAFYCGSLNENDIKQRIEIAAERLYYQHGTLIQTQIAQNAQPDFITPNMAAQLWARKFVSLRHNRACEGEQEKWYRRIINICHRLPSKPMAKFTKKMIEDLCTEYNIGGSAQNELYIFWEYCIDNGICSGKNPVKRAKRKKKSGVQQRNEAMKVYEMEPEMVEELYNLLSKPLTDTSVGVALMLSGFKPTDIVKFKWKDVTWHEEEDFVTIRFFKDITSNATKNYSRPVLPRVALLLQQHYKNVYKEMGKTDIADLFIVRNRRSKNGSPYKSDALVSDATRLLNLAGVSYRTLNDVRNEEREMAAARTILANTYARFIIGNCGLGDDPGTATFLLGESFKTDVTSDAYTSFTSPEGERRLYTILKRCQKNYYIKQPSNADNEFIDGRCSFFIAPSMTHDFLGITGDITLGPGEELAIRCPHGVDGQIVVECLEMSD